MTLSQCPTCRTPRPPDAARCLICGYAFPLNSAPESAARPVLGVRLRTARPGDQGWQVLDSARISRNDPTAAIVLADRSVSQRHASINFVNGEFMLVDDGSRNGTLVNGRKVIRPTPLRDGDQVSFGDVTVVVEVRRPTPATPPAADGGRTVLYAGGEPPGTVVTPERHRPVSRDDATVIEGGRRSGVDPQTGPGRVLRASEPPPLERAQAPTARLADLVADSQALSAALRACQQDLMAAMARFDQSGGRLTLQAVLERLRRIESGGEGNRDLEALPNWLPTVRSMLEAELSLIDLLAPLTSGPGGQSPRDKLQSYATYLDRVPEAH